MPAESLFTAREIAEVLGISRSAINERLSKVPPTGAKISKGQPSKAWSVAALPGSLTAELEKLRVKPDGTALFRSIEAMLLHSSAPFHVSAADDEQTREAARRRDVLAPLLALAERRGTPLAELARRARPHFAAPDGTLPALRTVEAWMHTARERDAGRSQWNRVDLYASTAPARPAGLTHGKGPQFPNADFAIRIFRETRSTSKEDGARVWHACFLDFEAAVQAGHLEREARGILLRMLCEPGAPGYPVKPDDLRKTFNLKLARWREAGRAPVATDGRACNGGSAKFTLTREESLALRAETLRRDSVQLAVEWFARRNPACRPETRAAILEHLDRAAAERKPVRWPPSIRRAAAVTDEERALFRGEKHAQQFAQVDRRGLFYEVEGERFPLTANCLWESDDMSLNEPFRHVSPETGAIALGRQTLCTIDVYSAHWIAAQPVGRIRDAYRVEDIADHMSYLVQAHGMPMFWRLERGVWESNFIEGIELPDGTRWGGLEPLFKVLHTWTSRGKGTIEGSFNHLQKLLAHESAHIGRSRGEFERATALMLKAQAGDGKAASHFWKIEEAADGLAAAMREFNHSPKLRRAHGKAPVVPADLFANAPRRELPASEAWRFCPVKRQATVRGGMIEMTVNHYPFPFRFAVNGVADGLHITQGHRVLVAFHPGRPEEGCHVFNAEPANDRNREGWKFGELMLVAQMAADAPQFSFTEREKSLHRRKNASAAVSTEFRAIGGGAQPHKRSEARDGNGNRAETTNAPRLKPTPSGEGDAFIAGAMAGRRSASPSAGRRELSPIEEQAELEAIERMERALGFEPVNGGFA